MENPLSAQILLLAATLLAGMALGLIYDVLRVLRRHCAAPIPLLCDMLFCLIFAAALFFMGMGPGRGTLRLYMPPLLLGGAAVWFVLFGAAGRRLFKRFFAALRKTLLFLLAPVKKAVKSMKKIKEILKNIFSIPKKWFTIIPNHATGIISRRAVGREGAAEENSNETETFRYTYKNRDLGADRLRGDQPGEHAGPHRKSGRRPRAAAVAGGRHAAGKHGA